jgi:hypothetical protein
MDDVTLQSFESNAFLLGDYERTGEKNEWNDALLPLLGEETLYAGALE